MGEEVKNALRQGLVDSIKLTYELDTELAKGVWTDADCVYYLALLDDENTRFLLYGILETWQKPERASPFWYLNEIIKRAPAHINWVKVDSYVKKSRWIYNWYSLKDKRSFDKDFPYLKKEIEKIIAEEGEKELSQREHDIKYFTNKTERMFWIKNKKEELLKLNPQRQLNDIAKQIHQELTQIFHELGLALDLKEDRILRIFNTKK